MNPTGKNNAWVMPPGLMPLLVSNQRRRIMPPTKTLRCLGLRQGMTLLDVGCGPGFFALPACRIVGRKGNVFACDTSIEMLREAKKKQKELALKNLWLKKCRDPEIPFPNAFADFVLVGFVFHETSDRIGFLSEVQRVLRSSGRAVFMEWRQRVTEYGPPLWARISLKEMKSNLRTVGLAVIQSWNFDNDTYFVIGRHKNRRSESDLFNGRIQEIKRGNRRE